MRARDPRFDDTSGSFDMDGFTCLGLEWLRVTESAIDFPNQMQVVKWSWLNSDFPFAKPLCQESLCILGGVPTLENSANKSGHEVVLEIPASDVLVLFPVLFRWAVSSVSFALNGLMEARSCLTF